MAAAVGDSAVLLARENCLDAMVDFAQRFRRGCAYSMAIAGNGSGVLNVPENPTRRIYIELDGQGGPVAEALLGYWIPTIGDSLYVTQPNVLGTGVWLVLGAAGTVQPCAT